MRETETYRINPSAIPPSEKCADPDCGHSFAAHGSNGMVCCACDCKQWIAQSPEVTLIVDAEIVR